MSIGFCEDCNSTGGHASYCPRWRKDAMTTPPMVTIWPSYTNQEDAMTTPTPRTIRLRSGIKTVNGITGETAPTYSEYVLLEDYQRDLAAAKEDLQFVERWANHHGVKPTCTAEAALSTIQHYPPILAITRSYADGKVPETRNPWAELQEAQEARQRAEAENELLREAVQFREAEMSRRVKECLATASDEITKRERAEALAEQNAKDAERGQRIMRLLASIFYYGAFTAESANERELQSEMEAAGWWPFKCEDDLIAAIDAARAK